MVHGWDLDLVTLRTWRAGGVRAVVLVSRCSETGQVQFCCPTGGGGTVCSAVPHNLMEELYTYRAQWEKVDHSALGQQKTQTETDVASSKIRMRRVTRVQPPFALHFYCKVDFHTFDHIRYGPLL